AGPRESARVRPGADERERYAVARHPRGETPELDGVVLCGKISAAAPRLVPDAPQTDAKRIAIAATLAQLGERGGARGRIAVLDPLVEIAGRQAAQVGGEIRRTARKAAEPHEFVRAERVWLVLAG